MSAHWGDPDRVRDAIQVTVGGLLCAAAFFVLLWAAAALAILMGGTP